MAAAYGYVDINEAAEVIAERNAAVKKSQQELPGYAREFNEIMEKQGGDVNKAFKQLTTGFNELKNGKIKDGLINFYSGEIKTVGEVLDQIGSAVVRPRGTVRSLTESLAFSAPSLALGFTFSKIGAVSGANVGAIVGGIVVPGPVGAAAGATIGSGVGGLSGFVTGSFIGSSTVEIGAWINQSLEERGYDTSSPDDIIAAYSNKKLLAEIRGEAERKGITTAGVDAFFTVFAGKFLKGAVGAPVAKKAVAAAKDIGVQATGEAASEFAGQVAAREGDLEKVNLGEAITEGIVSMGHSVGDTMVGASFRGSLSADPIVAAEETFERASVAKETLNDAQAVQELIEISKESELQTRNPEVFSDFVAEVNDLDGEQAVYFQKDDWDEFWKNKGESPVKKAEELLGSTEIYNDAEETGQPLKAPMGDYVTKAGSDESVNELMKIIRTQPDGMTVEEAKETMQTLPGTVEDLAKEVNEQQKFLEESEEDVRQIRESIERQLVVAGRDKIEAVPIVEFYRTMGIKEGISPSDLAKKYKLTIRKGDEKAAKGKISGNENFTISLLEKADKSTFLHESGHYFLEVTKDMASMGQSSQELKDDFKTILDWFGIESANQITTEHHEMWARGFEAYLREGKAPTSKLRRAFNTFKVWLTSVYKSFAQLNVNLTPEVRDVMDRMLATREEIELARKRTSDNPLFVDPVAAGMRQEQANKYFQAQGNAQMSAEEMMQSRLIKDRERQLKVKRKKFREESENEANSLRMYNTMSILKKGTLADGSALPEGSFPIKLNKAEFLEKYPQFKGNKNFHGMFSKENDVDLEIASSVLGYDSVDTMMTEIANAPNKREYINFLTDEKVNDIEKDLLNSEEIASQAERMVHNMDRGKRLRMEYEYLATNNKGLSREIIRRVTKRPAPQREIKALAERIINNLTVDNVKPNTYRLAERRYAKKAGEELARGDIQGAFEAKEKELLNYELYRMAAEAKQKIQKDIKNSRKIFDKDEKLAKTRDMDLVNAARAILSRYGLGKTKKEPVQYIQKIKEYNPDAYESISSIVVGAIENPDMYTNVPYGQFRDMMDSVKALWDLSKDAKEIEIGGKKVQIEKAAEEMSSGMEKFKKSKNKEKYSRTLNDHEKFGIDLLGLKAQFRRFEHWIDVMDLGNIAGPFRKYLFNEVSEATDRYTLENKKYKERFLELSKPIQRK